MMKIIALLLCYGIKLPLKVMSIIQPRNNTLSLWVIRGVYIYNGSGINATLPLMIGSKIFTARK